MTIVADTKIRIAGRRDEVEKGSDVGRDKSRPVLFRDCSSYSFTITFRSHLDMAAIKYVRSDKSRC